MIRRSFLLITFTFFFILSNNSWSFPIKSFFNLFGKNKVVFAQCYRERDKNYDDFKKFSEFERWDWEINLKEKKAVRVSIFKFDQKVRTNTYRLESITDEYISTMAMYGASYVFDRKTGKIQISTNYNIGKKPSIMTCEKF